MSPRPWSLARRLTGLYLLSIAVFVFAISGLSAWFVRANLNNELDLLAHEELVDLRESFDQLAPEPGALEHRLSKLADQHHPCKFAWRVWKSDGPLLEFGDKELLGEDRPRWTTEDLGKLERTGPLRWKTERVSKDVVVGVVIDGSPRLAQLKRYEVYAVGIIIVGILFAVLLATLFFRRVSGLLARVAEHARTIRDPDRAAAIDIPDAPIEILEVTRALEQMLENIRFETQQARIFTAGLAHELRSPVQNLIGETEVALINERAASTYCEVLRSNLEELRSLGDAIDNLVTICSAGDTQRSSAREYFDLAVEAEIRLRRERSLAERLGIAFDLATSGDAHVTGDREALLRAVRNVTANAIQWSDAGGHVSVEIRGRDDELVIGIDDDGPGVPDELQKQIFEPFFRGPSAKGRRIGYGLGLALTRTAIEEQGGSITVGRSPLGGARFELRLPRRGRRAQAALTAAR